MAKRMETKSARILALILALIMIGSVVVYVFRGSTKVSEREIKFEMGKFPKLLNYTPYGAQFVLYLNFENLDRESELYRMLNDVFKNQIDPYSFSHSALASKTGIRSVLIAKYPYPLYFVDVNRSKVYFASESKEEYKGYKVKLRKGVALIDETSPFVLGYPTFVFEVDTSCTGSSTLIGAPGVIASISSKKPKLPLDSFSVVSPCSSSSAKNPQAPLPPDTDTFGTDSA